MANFDWSNECHYKRFLRIYKYYVNAQYDL